MISDCTDEDELGGRVTCLGKATSIVGGTPSLPADGYMAGGADADPRPKSCGVE